MVTPASAPSRVAVLLAVLLTAGCGARSAKTPPAAPASVLPTVHSVLHCLRAVGADAHDVSSRRDLRVSVGEVAASFSTFDVYIGIAARRAEARAAAGTLDSQLAVLQQAGAARVEGRTVFYSDGVAVPDAAGRLVSACTRGDEAAAGRAIVAVAAELPVVELPAPLPARFRARCRTIGTTSACTCAYRRAARLFRFSQVAGLGWEWPRRRALPVFAGLLRTCSARGAATY